jgi:tetratricopeptide (TPR) repeat protein
MGQRNSASARPLLEESYKLFKEFQDERGQAYALYFLGMAAYFSGDRAAARTHYEESLRMFTKFGDAFGVTLVNSALEVVIFPERDEETSRLLYEQSLPLLRSSANKGRLAMTMINTGDAILGQYPLVEHAKTLYKQGLHLSQEMKESDRRTSIARGLAGLANVAMAQGQAQRAGILFGASDQFLGTGSKYRKDLDRQIAEARTRLDLRLFIVGWKLGQTMTEEQVIAEALK